MSFMRDCSNDVAAEFYSMQAVKQFPHLQVKNLSKREAALYLQTPHRSRRMANRL